MASLTGSTIAASYEQLLSLPDGGLNGNTLVAITDGDSSTAIGMKVATSKIEVIPASDDANAFEVSNAAGTAILTINSSTTSASLVQTVTTATSTPKALFIDTNTSGVAAQNSVGMHIDFDRTVAGSGTAAHNDIGIDLDVNSASLGTSSLVGMDIDVVGATSGTSTATGVNIAVGSADTNYALITSGGNVGIGVADPDETLEVSGDAKVSGNLYFYDTGGESISSNGSVLSIAGGAEIDLTATDIDINGAVDVSGALVIGGDVTMAQSGQAILHIDSTADAAQIKLSALSDGADYEWSIYSDNAADKFLIVDGSATRLVIDASGNVGIGDTTPDGRLELATSGTDSQTLQTITGYNDQAAYVSQLVVRKSHSDTLGTRTTTVDTEKLGMVLFQGVDSGSNWDYGAYITAIQDGSAGTTIPTNLVFETYSNSAINSNQLVLHNDGRVGIGEGNPGAANLQVVGTSGSTGCMVINAESQLADGDKIFYANFNNNSNNPDDDGHFFYAQDNHEHKFSVYSDGDVFSRSGDDVASLSDERLKTNISDYKDGLALINSLKPKKFNWKEGINRPSDTQYGFLAQEIEEVSDKSMRLYKKRTLGEDASEHKYIDDGLLYTSQLKGKDAQYVSAIQELHTIIQELSAKVEALENA